MEDSMNRIRLTLNFPPTANHLHAVARGRKVLSKKGKAYYSSVEASWMEQGMPTIGGLLKVEIALHPPDTRAYDCDNRIKAVQDALEKAGVYGNDKQIKWVCAYEAGEFRAICSNEDAVWVPDIVEDGMAVVSIEEWAGMGVG